MIRILLLLTFFGWNAQGRVFNFSGEKFAPYVRGSYLTTSTGDSAFAKSGGTGTTYDKKNAYNSSFEFGFAYGIKNLRLKFGFEVFKPPNLVGVTGRNASGTALYTLNSDVLGYAPKVGVELNLKQWPETRIFLSGDFGAMSATVKNTYALTADGTAAYPTVVNFTEELKTSGQAIDASLGVETLMFDSTTFSFELGYRTLAFKNLKHNLPVTTFQNAVIKGDAALNDDGTSRSMSFSNVYAAMGFRFWIF